MANVSLIMSKESILLVSRWIKQLVQEDELRLIMQGVCGEEDNHEKLSRSLASENLKTKKIVLIGGQAFMSSVT